MAVFNMCIYKLRIYMKATAYNSLVTKNAEKINSLAL